MLHHNIDFAQLVAEGRDSKKISDRERKTSSNSTKVHTTNI